MKNGKIFILFFITIFCIHLTQSCKNKNGHNNKSKNSQPSKTETNLSNEGELISEKNILEGGPYPSLFITQSRFLPADDGSGKNTKPGPARLIILRKKGKLWEKITIDDKDSNVFHKAAQLGSGIITAGATGAFLKLWKFQKSSWNADVLWNPKFGGKFDRLRDFEIGKVMPGSYPQITVATHDQGVIGVVRKSGEKWEVMEIDREPDTFVHEIELGDFDGDGLNEIFATPSMPNKIGVSQAGEVVMYRWNGIKFEKTTVKKFETRHVKEILVTRLFGESFPSLFAVAEAELETVGGKTRIKAPTEILRFIRDKNGNWFEYSIGRIPDSQTRFLVAGDIDNDGKTELIAAAMKTGLWLFRPPGTIPAGGTGKNENLLENLKKSQWEMTNFERESSGYEHATCIADMNEDGKQEIYVAADDQRTFSVYTWNGMEFVKEIIMPLESSVITWNITAGKI